MALVTKMVEVVRKYQLEILHVHYAIPHAYAACMARQMLADEGIKVKVVTTLHGTDINLIGNQPSYKTAVTYSIKNSDAITAVSKNLKKETLSFFNINRHIEVIYNFINTKYNFIKRDCNKTLITKSDEKIITHISNFRPVKRVQDVLAIFEHIRQKIPAKLLLVGEGPLMEKVREHAKKIGIYKHIIFFGNTDEMAKILCCSDLFLLPSEAESFGLVALEAMAAGTPVISTNVGGLPEVNIHGKTGYLNEIGAIKKMAKDALKILNDPVLWETFSKAATRQAQKFNAADIVAQYENVYENVLYNDSN